MRSDSPAKIEHNTHSTKMKRPDSEAYFARVCLCNPESSFVNLVRMRLFGSHSKPMYMNGVLHAMLNLFMYIGLLRRAVQRMLLFSPTFVPRALELVVLIIFLFALVPSASVSRLLPPSQNRVGCGGCGTFFFCAMRSESPEKQNTTHTD